MASGDKRVSGKVALISGAAQGVTGEVMGFGGASARLLAEHGASVVIGDIDEPNGELTASQIRDSGGQATFVRLDVTQETDWQSAVQAAVAEYGGLDILINSAGTTAPGGVLDTSVEMWNSQLDLHGKGAFLGIKYSVPEMRKRGGGSIVNLSSTDGMVGGGFSAAYSAAKGANWMLAKTAAVQYAPENIRVNSLHPGELDTPLARSAMSDILEQDPDFKDPRLDWIPLGRLGTADDVSHLILYLASDESSYVTGAEFVIDGGMIARGAPS
jgi:cyclopentanol dehydrogenase